MGDNQEQLTLFSVPEANDEAPKEKRNAVRKERKKEQQPNMFASSYEKPNFPKHVRLIEFFAGIGAQAKALEILNADFEHWRTCEWSWQSIVAYNAIHMGGRIEDTSSISYDEVISRIQGVSNDYNQPMTEAQLRKKGEKWARELLGRMIANRNVCPNVSALHAEDLDIRERNTYVLTYSFPCFTGDQMLLTKDKGYIPFKEAQVGQLVLGKDGKWHPIVKFFDNGTRETAFVEAMGFAKIHTTPDHKFWVRKMKRVGHKRVRSFSQPDWVHAKDLSKDCYLGVPVVEEETPFHTEDLHFWELIGIYVGDGWIHDNAVLVCGNERKRNRLSELLADMGIAHNCRQDSAHCWRFRIPDQGLVSFIEKNIGSGCKTKRIPYSILALPKPQLESFLDGYVSADGCHIDGKTQLTTTNENLAYSVALIVNKLYKRVCCVYEIETPKTCVIEGRTVNQSNWYQLRFKKENSKQDKAFYEDGFLWYPFKRYYEAEPDHVYDIEVEETHSFTLNGCIVSNCQDLSNAGQMKGMDKGSGTRSGLLWEVERILLECKELDCLPQVLVMENVPNVIGSSNIEPFNQWLDSLHRMGYTNYYEIMNASDYAIPQSRNRCFMVSVLGQYSFEFPKPMPLKYLIKDFISPKVDESYYLPNWMVEDFQRCVSKYENAILPTNWNMDEIRCVCLGSVHAPSFNEMAGRVYSTIGLSPTVRTFCGGGQETKIMVENKEEEMTSEYELSDAMQRYIVSKNGKYIVGKSVLNPTIAKPITTREGQTRADTSTYLSPDCPPDCEIIADEDGYPRRKDMETNKRLRIRKLTESECYRFMGFQRKDYEACVKAGQSKSSIYHQAGDSIVTTCLVGIFGELLGLDYERIIQDYADGLHKEVSE